jgi:CRP-like cAMP-binding protein
MISVTELQSITALSRLSAAQLERLSSYMSRREYTPGELIFLEGDPAHGVWFVLEGRVRIIKHSETGRVQALCTASSGKCFGGCPLFDGDVNPANAQAINDVTLAILNDEDREQLSERDPELLWVLLQIFSDRLSHLARLGEGLGAWKVNTRINDCLVTHSTDDEIHLTHERIAEIVGTAREVVSRHLSTLEKDGLIALEPGHIRLLEPDSLRCGCLAPDVT